MPAVPLAEITRFLDGYLDTRRVPDYRNALNGLQVEGIEVVSRFAVAVDARESVIEAVRDWADLLIVHHGLFWSGLQPLTGPAFRRVKALIESGTALYSAHLPLDGHPEVGNAAILARKLGLKDLLPFGEYEGFHVGCRGSVAGVRLSDFAARLSKVLNREATVLPGGPDPVSMVAIATGGGASQVAEAAAVEADVLVTGEAQHHHAIDAAELGVTILLGGHYETETWGVRKIAELLTGRFGIEGRFVDIPSGL